MNHFNISRFWNRVSLPFPKTDCHFSYSEILIDSTPQGMRENGLTVSFPVAMFPGEADG